MRGKKPVEWTGVGQQNECMERGGLLPTRHFGDKGGLLYERIHTCTRYTAEDSVLSLQVSCRDCEAKIGRKRRLPQVYRMLGKGEGLKEYLRSTRTDGHGCKVDSQHYRTGDFCLQGRRRRFSYERGG